MDQTNIKNSLQYFKNLNQKISLLLFPEGTDFIPKSKYNSEKYAIQHNLPKYEFCLHPKTTGFEFIIDQMRQNRQIDYVYDLSVAYPCNVLQSEMELCLIGNFPKEVHFHVERFEVGKLPASYAMNAGSEPLTEATKNSKISEKTLADWLIARFQLKENRLENFYQPSKIEDRNFDTVANLSTYSRRQIGMIASLIFWPICFIYWICWMRSSFWFLISQVLVVVFYIFFSVFYDGFEIFLNSFTQKFFKPKLE